MTCWLGLSNRLSSPVRAKVECCKTCDLFGIIYFILYHTCGDSWHVFFKKQDIVYSVKIIPYKIKNISIKFSELFILYCIMQHFRENQCIYSYCNEHFQLVSKQFAFECLIGKIQFTAISFLNKKDMTLPDEIWNKFQVSLSSELYSASWISGSNWFNERESESVCITSFNIFLFAVNRYLFCFTCIIILKW